MNKKVYIVRYEDSINIKYEKTENQRKIEMFENIPFGTLYIEKLASSEANFFGAGAQYENIEQAKKRFNKMKKILSQSH